MIDYVNGKIAELTPTDIVVDINGIGFHAQISLQTYSEFENRTEAKLYMHHILREDEELFYGFATKEERNIFRQIISVSGVGASTARMMLSSLNSEELRNAIIGEDVNKIKAIKGIGIKTAQRIILELKDKVIKGEEGSSSALFSAANTSSIADEATTALVMLGFAKANVNKVVAAVLKEKPTATIEEVIKFSLKKL